MNIKHYNKLVRDKIPEIIKNTGRSYEIEVLNGEAYLTKLNEKLGEEVNELINSKATEAGEELADVIEVLLAIADYRGIDMEEVEFKRNKKLEERGGFHKRILLKAVSNKE